MENHVGLTAEQSREVRSSTAAPTPGPWSVYDGGFQSDVFRKGKTVCLNLSSNGDAMAVAYCDYHTEEIARANARLIAAAPDLLAALTDMVDLHDIDVTDGTIKTAKGSERWRRVGAARAAIAKATGAA